MNMYTKQNKSRCKHALYVFLMGILMLGADVQAQVAIDTNPSRFTDLEPPIDIDPDIFRTLSEDGRTRVAENCGGCTGIVKFKFDSTTIVLGSGGDANELRFDIQIKAEQAPERGLDNVAQIITAYINYGELAFGSRQFDGGNLSGQPATDAKCYFETIATDETFNLTFRQDEGDEITFGHFANNIGQLIYSRLGGTINANRYRIPHEDYDAIARISCAIEDASQPARIAFSAGVVSQTSQLGNGVPNATYAAVGDNHLWYYPLDGAPAIIDAEFGVSAQNSYVDITFSEGVQKGDESALTVENFASEEGGAVGRINIWVDDLDDSTSTQALTIARISRRDNSPVQAGDEVVRVHFDQDILAIQETSGGDPFAPAYLIIAPVATTTMDITDSEGNALHADANSGSDDWKLRVWFDSNAPYIETAEVGPSSQYIDITFSSPVKFAVEFGATGPMLRDIRLLNDVGPSVEDFIVTHYDASEGVEKTINLQRVEIIESGVVRTSPGVGDDGAETLRLVLPAEYDQTSADTVDIRIAERVKDPTHPSLSPIFAYYPPLDPGVSLDVPSTTKRSKFATAAELISTASDVSNFPRTPAFAQVGSLPLTGLEYTIVSSSVPSSGEAKAGQEFDITFRLTAEDDVYGEDEVSITGFDITPGGVLVSSVPSTFNAANDYTVTAKFRVGRDVATGSSVQIVPTFAEDASNPSFSVEDTPVQVSQIQRDIVIQARPPIIPRLTRGGIAEIYIEVSDEAAELIAGESVRLEFSLITGDQDSTSVVGIMPLPITETTLSADSPSVKLTIEAFNDLPDEEVVRLHARVAVGGVQGALGGVLIKRYDAIEQAEDVGDIAQITVVGGRTFDLVFSPTSGTIEVGESISVELSLEATGDPLVADEYIMVDVQRESIFTAVTFVTAVTFTADSTQKQITLLIDDSNQPRVVPFVAGRRSESSSPVAVGELEIIPPNEVTFDLTIVPVVPPKASLEQAFTTIAPGAVRQEFDDTAADNAEPVSYIIIPSRGPDGTSVDLRELTKVAFGGDRDHLGVCMGDRDNLERGDCLKLSDGENAEKELNLFTNVLHWVGLTSTSAGKVEPEQVRRSINVYVAPVIGFSSRVQFYNSPQGIDPMLNLPIKADVRRVISLNLQLEIVTSDSQQPSLLMDLQIEPAGDIKHSISYPTTETIVAIESVNNFIFTGEGEVTTGTDTVQFNEKSLSDDKLYTLGNTELQLLDREEQGIELSDLSIIPTNRAPYFDGTLLQMETTVSEPATVKVSIFRSRTTITKETTITATTTATRTDEIGAEEIKEIRVESGGSPVLIKIVADDDTTGNIEIKIGSRDTITVSLPEGKAFDPSIDNFFEIRVTQRPIDEGGSESDSRLRLIVIDPMVEKLTEPTLGEQMVYLGLEDQTLYLGPYTHRQERQNLGSTITFTTGFDSGLLNSGLPNGTSVDDAVAEAGVFDFAITTENPGDLAILIIELNENEEENEEGYEGYELYKYNANEWGPFLGTLESGGGEFDRAYTAPAPCPSAQARRQGDNEKHEDWHTWRLINKLDQRTREGDQCLLLVIQDGGINDADETANRIIFDSNALALSGGSSSSSGGGGSMDLMWLMLLALSMLLPPLLRRKIRTPNVSRQ